MIGIDTSAIIDILRGGSKVIKLIEKLDDELYLNDVVYSELIFGININNKKHLIEEKKIDFLFDKLNNLSLATGSIKKASLIKWDLKSKGITIDKEDCLIAGIFLENGVDKIITKNKKHFEKIRGLKVLSY